MKTKKFLAMLLSGLIVMSATAVSAFAEESETHTHNYTGEDVKVTAKITIPAPSEDYWKQGSTITLTNDAEFTLESIDAIICRAEGSAEVIDYDLGLYAELNENTISLLSDPPTNLEQDSLEIKVSCLTSEAMESDSFSAELNGVDLTVSNNPVNDFRAEPIEEKNSHKAYCVYSDCEEYIEEECSFTDGVCVCGRKKAADPEPEPEVCTHNYTGKNAEVKILISLPDGLERGSEVVISNDSDFSLTAIKKLIAREQGSTEVIDDDIELYCEIQGDNTIEFLSNNPANWDDKPIEIMVYAKTSEDIASDSFSATMNGEELSVSNSSVKSEVTKGENGKHKTYCVYGCGEFVEEDCTYTEGVCVCGREREENNSPINYISFEVAKPVAGEPAETYGTIDESSKSLSITAKTESGETLGTSDLKSYYAYIMEVDTEKNTGGWNVYRDNYVAGSTYALLYDIKTYNEIADDCEVYVNGVKAIAWPEEFTYSGDLLVYERLTDGYGVAGLKGFYVSYPSSSGGSSSGGSSSSGSSSSSSSSSSTTEPEKTEEKVDVKEETAKIEDAEKGEKVEVKIEGTVVPKDYIESAMVSDAIVIVSYGEYEWQISDVEEPKAVDLSIDTNAVGKIKKEIVETLEGDNTNVIDIKHNGNLGFKGTLKYNVKKENAGKYVNLYYYNIETGKLELQGSTKIDEKGFVHLPFTHCSTYVLNITSDPATSTLFEDLSAGESATVVEETLPAGDAPAVTEAPAQTEAASNPATGNSAAALVAIPVAIAAAAIISKKR